jgi:hypothetical protein
MTIHNHQLGDNMMTKTEYYFELFRDPNLGDDDCDQIDFHERMSEFFDSILIKSDNTLLGTLIVHHNCDFYMSSFYRKLDKEIKHGVTGFSDYGRIN